MLRFWEVVRRRHPKTGKFVGIGEGGFIERVTQTRIKGKIVEVAIESRKMLLKQTTVADTGDKKGLIFSALAKTNAMAAGTMKGAKRIDVNISLRDRAEKTRRLRFSIDVEGAKDRIKGKPLKASKMLLSRIIWEMHRRGFRTNYPLDVVPMKHGKKAALARLERAEQVKITVRIKK